jgi:hypothetical protein
MIQERYPKAAEDIVEQLLSPFAFWRNEGEQQLLTVSSHQPDFLLSVFYRLGKKEEERRTSNANTMVTSLVLGGALGTIMMIVSNSVFPLFGFPVASFVAGVLNVTFNNIFTTSRIQNAKETVVQLLAERMDDVRICGILAESLEYRASHTRQTVINALKRLLLRVEPEDNAYFDVHQRERLYRALDCYDDVFVLSLLHAIEQIGDASALYFVERRLRVSGHSEAIIRAATRCLAVLQARAEKAHAVETLLRPSSAESAAPETLLRPVSSTGIDEEPETLLRATESGVENPAQESLHGTNG